MNNIASLITAHMNAPMGNVLGADDVVQSLRLGRLSGRSDAANAVLGYLFIEMEPRVIANCALEAGCALHSANLLYLDTLDHASPRSPQWEVAVEGLL